MFNKQLPFSDHWTQKMMICPNFWVSCEQRGKVVLHKHESSAKPSIKQFRKGNQLQQITIADYALERHHKLFSGSVA